MDLKDPDGRQIRLPVPPEPIPDQAYEKLFEIDWSERESGLLMWYEEEKSRSYRAALPPLLVEIAAAKAA